CVAQQARFGSQYLELIGVTQKIVDGERNQVARRLTTRRDHEGDHADDFFRGELLALLFRMDQLAEEIVAGFLAPFVHDLFEHRDAAGKKGHLLAQRLRADYRVEGIDDRTAEQNELFLPLAGYPEQ